MEAQELLKELREERNKFEPQNPRMQEIVDSLVELGEYPVDTPAQLEYGYTPLRMVESWGVDWHKWREPNNCPHCDADLRDHANGPPFKREIGQYDRSLDRTVAWVCPDCKEQWPSA